MAGPFDLIPSQNLFECKPVNIFICILYFICTKFSTIVAPHMSGQAGTGTRLRSIVNTIGLKLP
jgi:hypothetical protein